MFRIFISFFVFSAFILTAYASQAAGALTIVGWVEKVHLDTIDTTFAGKLDSGAKTSSLDAEIIKLVKPHSDEKSDHGSVVFSVSDDEQKTRVLERKIKRWVRIKKKEGGFLRRPVVKMTFCIANTAVTEEVNLSKRDHFLYPVLIGRNMLSAGHLLVDASKTFTSKPNCKADL